MNDPRVADLVAALERQLPADGEILVADDGDPGTLPTLAGARVVPVHGGNPGRARNEGAARARGGILLFTDADVHLADDWVSNAMALFEDPAVLAIQGNTRSRGTPRLAALLDHEYREFVRSHAATGYADMCDSRCFGIRREVFERFPFDDTEPYVEDAQLGRRLYEAGIAIRFESKWQVEHDTRGSVRGELVRFRGYASASQRHLLRSGRDLFRSPAGAPPRGPGASLLRVAARLPFASKSLGRAAWVTARALGRAAEVRTAAACRLFLLARRAAGLSGRLDPAETSQQRLAVRASRIVLRRASG